MPSFNLVGLDTVVNLTENVEYPEYVPRDISASYYMHLYEAPELLNDVFHFKTTDPELTSSTADNDMAFKCEPNNWPDLPFSEGVIRNDIKQDIKTYSIPTGYHDRITKNIGVQWLAKNITGGYNNSDIFANEEALQQQYVNLDSSGSYISNLNSNGIKEKLAFKLSNGGSDSNPKSNADTDISNVSRQIFNALIGKTNDNAYRKGASIEETRQRVNDMIVTQQSNQRYIITNYDGSYNSTTNTLVDKKGTNDGTPNVGTLPANQYNDPEINNRYDNEWGNYIIFNGTTNFTQTENYAVDLDHESYSISMVVRPTTDALNTILSNTHNSIEINTLASGQLISNPALLQNLTTYYETDGIKYTSNPNFVNKIENFWGISGHSPWTLTFDFKIHSYLTTSSHNHLLLFRTVGDTGGYNESSQTQELHKVVVGLMHGAGVGNRIVFNFGSGPGTLLSGTGLETSHGALGWAHGTRTIFTTNQIYTAVDYNIFISYSNSIIDITLSRANRSIIHSKYQLQLDNDTSISSTSHEFNYDHAIENYKEGGNSVLTRDVEVMGRSSGGGFPSSSGYSGYVTNIGLWNTKYNDYNDLRSNQLPYKSSLNAPTINCLKKDEWNMINLIMENGGVNAYIGTEPLGYNLDINFRRSLILGGTSNNFVGDLASFLVLNKACTPQELVNLQRELYPNAMNPPNQYVEEKWNALKFKKNDVMEFGLRYLVDSISDSGYAKDSVGNLLGTNKLENQNYICRINMRYSKVRWVASHIYDGTNVYPSISYKGAEFSDKTTAKILINNYLIYGSAFPLNNDISANVSITATAQLQYIGLILIENDDASFNVSHPFNDGGDTGGTSNKNDFIYMDTNGPSIGFNEYYSLGLGSNIISRTFNWNPSEKILYINTGGVIVKRGINPEKYKYAVPFVLRSDGTANSGEVNGTVTISSTTPCFLRDIPGRIADVRRWYYNPYHLNYEDMSSDPAYNIPAH